MAAWWSRPLLPLTAALAAGIAAGPSWGARCPPGFLGFSFVLLLFLIALFLVLHWDPILPALALFFLAGLGLAHAACHPPLPAQHIYHLPRQADLSLRGVVQDWPRQRGGEQEIVLAAVAWAAPQGWQAATGQVLIRGLPGNLQLAPSQEVVLRLRLAPKDTSSAPKNLSLARRQIWVSGWWVRGGTVVRLAVPPAAGPALSWRQQVHRSARLILAERPEPLRGVYRALLLGDQSGLSAEQRRAFQETGTSHILSVSGLHLVMVWSWVGWLLFWLLRRWTWLLLRLNIYKTALILAWGPMLIYAWLTGWSPATQRAALMLIGAVLVLVLERPRDFLSLLALAALVILVWSPLQLFALSFQLSFLSVAGIYFLYPTLNRPGEKLAALIPENRPWLQTVGRRSFQLLAVSLAATLATLPCLLAVFHRFPTVGVAVNVLAVPLVGLFVLPLGLVGLLAAFISGPLSQVFFLPADLAGTVALKIIQTVAALPLVVSLPTPNWLQLGGYYLILGLLVGSWSWRWRGAGLSLGLILVLSPWLLLLLPVANSSLTLAVFGNAKELALAATLPDRQLLVISAGGQVYPPEVRPPSWPLLDYLQRQPRRQLAHLVILTLSPANLGTLQALIQDFTVEQIYYNGERPRLPAFWEWRNQVGDRQLPIRNLALAPWAAELGGVQVRSRQLRPTPTARPSGPVWVEVSYQGRRLLILPPAPRDWWSQLTAEPLPPVDLLILPAEQLHLKAVLDLVTRLNPPWKIAVGSPRPAGPDWTFAAQRNLIIQLDQRSLRLHQEAPSSGKE